MKLSLKKVAFSYGCGGQSFYSRYGAFSMPNIFFSVPHFHWWITTNHHCYKPPILLWNSEQKLFLICKRAKCVENFIPLWIFSDCKCLQSDNTTGTDRWKGHYPYTAVAFNREFPRQWLHFHSAKFRLEI